MHTHTLYTCNAFYIQTDIDMADSIQSPQVHSCEWVTKHCVRELRSWKPEASRKRPRERAPKKIRHQQCFLVFWLGFPVFWTRNGAHLDLSIQFPNRFMWLMASTCPIFKWCSFCSPGYFGMIPSYRTGSLFLLLWSRVVPNFAFFQGCYNPSWYRLVS